MQNRGTKIEKLETKTNHKIRLNEKEIHTNTHVQRLKKYTK